MIVDELRIIEHTNTQVRFLAVISQIIQSIGGRSTSLTILKNNLIRWSIEQEKESDYYSNHNGILTNKGKPTTAFKYYIEVLENMGLITRINEVVRNSKYGQLLLTLKKYGHEQNCLSSIEKIFYLFFLLLKDGDSIVMLFSIIEDNGGIANYKYLRSNYDIYLKARLLAKRNLTNRISQNSINEKLRTIEYIWQNAPEYSKHIVPPRIEWLIDLGLISTVANNKILTFKLSPFGKEIFKSFELINNSNIRDINDTWLMDKFILNIPELSQIASGTSNMDDMDEITCSALLSQLLPLAYKELDNDGIRRVSALPFYIFVMSIGLSKFNVRVSFSSLKNKLLGSFSTGGITFAFREASRINESYLTVSIN